MDSGSGFGTAASDRTSETDPPFTTIGPDARSYERYADVTLEDDVLLLYDRHIEDAWIISDVTVSLAEDS